MASKSKIDTPSVKISTRSMANKNITLDDIWSLLSNIESKLTSHDTSLNDLKVKLSSLDSTFKEFKKSLDNVSAELVKVKQDNTILNSEVKALHERVFQLEHTRSSNCLTDFDIVEESRARILKENNLVIFNVSDSINEDASVPLTLVKELFQDLSCSVTVSSVVRLGKFGSRPRPILVKLYTSSEVRSVLRSKSKIRNIHRWKEVSISEDMTSLQRSHMKSLRSQLRTKRESGDLNWFIKYVRGVPTLVQKN